MNFYKEIENLLEEFDFLFDQFNMIKIMRECKS